MTYLNKDIILSQKHAQLYAVKYNIEELKASTRHETHSAAFSVHRNGGVGACGEFYEN